jgi:hypothetical protein
MSQVQKPYWGATLNSANRRSHQCIDIIAKYTNVARANDIFSRLHVKKASDIGAACSTGWEEQKRVKN